MSEEMRRVPHEGEQGVEEAAYSNVTPLFARQEARRESPPTDEELAEYRRIRPLLLQLIEEWKTLKGASGCPVMRHVLPRD